MKRFLFEIQIGFLVIVGVALVLATGYLAYTGMGNILQNVKKESKPDMKLGLIQMLATDVKKAENSIRVYSFSKNSRDLSPYYRFLTEIDDRFDTLYAKGAGNVDFNKNMDTIAQLVGQKIRLWQEMLPLYTTTQTEQYLDTLSRELEQKIISDSLRKNRTFLQKIFKRQAKVDLDEQRLVEGLEEAQVEDSIKTARIRSKERQLAEASSLLTRQFYDLIKRMEANEMRVRQGKVLEADRMARETYRWIGYFSLAAVLSLLLVIFVITRYARKSHQYQKALIAAKQETENLAKAKELFTANVSHELRTPINVISGFIDQMLKRPQDNKNKETIRIIKSSTDHLVRIVNDILDFTKLESGKMVLERIHFKSREIFGEIIHLFGPSAKEKGIDLEVSVDEQVPEVLYGDPIRIKQILINLLGNALKFTEKGSVKVNVKTFNQIAGHLDLQIAVEDTGIGIPADKLDLIFEDFSQAESDTSRKFGGTGLGLSIVNKLVDLHNGEIRVKSEPNEGTVFTCKLPYKQGKEELIETGGMEILQIPDEIKNRKILVVDDEPYNRKLVGTILDRWDIPYSEAGSGEEALEIIRTGSFDLVLLDNRMPGMDGLSTAREINEQIGKKHPAPVLVSFSAAIPSKDQESAYRKAGITLSLPKPFTEEELLNLLSNVFDAGEVMVKTGFKPLVKEESISEKDLDLSQLYRVAGGDEPFVKEMLEKFLEAFQAGYKEIEKAIEKENFTEVGNAAHKLVSPCRHLGADNLVSLLKFIETKADEDPSRDELEGSVQLVKKAYESIRMDIMDHLNTMKAKT